MIIKNRGELATTALKEQALRIIEAGIDRVLPRTFMQAALRYEQASKSLLVKEVIYNLSKSRVFIIGGGKATELMAKALEDIMGAENIFMGIVNCQTVTHTASKIKIIKAGHPMPDERGFNGVKQMLALKQKFSIKEKDLVICLLSGGGSALMPYPAKGISLENKQSTTELLIKCGAEIHEINAVRKHLSRIKGGRLGKFYSPVKVVSLILSDVVGDNLDVIASGPTFPDTSTFQDAYNVLEKYNLIAKAPQNIVAFLKKGCEGKMKETPKTLTNCDNYIIGNNKLALEAMAEKAKEMGFNPYIVTSHQKGDTADVAYARAREIIEGQYKEYNAIIIGGETTPTLPENAGRGGRNQHYVAVSMLAMRPYPGQWIVASVGTDGSDYLPDVAGAMVDNSTFSRTIANQIDAQAYINRFDSNTLFQKIGGSLIMTGNTGTNVSDVMLYLLK